MTEFPRGPIPRVERQQSHYDFLWAVRPPYAMVDLIHARRIAAYDGPFFPPETEGIVTTTVSDDVLSTFSFIDELRVLAAVEPAYVIPFDLPVYESMERTQRRENITQIAAGTIETHRLTTAATPQMIPEQLRVQLEHADVDIATIHDALSETTVLPLMKGFNALERKVLRDCAETITAPCMVKYGVQYMTVGGAGNYPELITSLQNIADETSNFPVIVIGLQSPEGMFSLEKVPDNVVAAAGTNQWTKHVEPVSTAPSEMQTAYRKFSQAVCETLGVDDPYTVPRDSTQVSGGELPMNPGNAVTDELSVGTAGAAGDGEFGFGQRKRPSDAADALTAGLQGAASFTDDSTGSDDDSQ